MESRKHEQQSQMTKIQNKGIKHANMWELWRVEILAFPLTGHIAYITACC